MVPSCLIGSDLSRRLPGRALGPSSLGIAVAVRQPLRLDRRRSVRRSSRGDAANALSRLRVFRSGFCNPCIRQCRVKQEFGLPGGL